MPPAMPVDQELLLKKRARRRLVGAIGLVILLMVVLPLVLKDRVKTTSNEHAKIVMNEGVDGNQLPPTFESKTEISQFARSDEESSINNEKAQLLLNEDSNQGNAVANQVQTALPSKSSSDDLIANKVAELERKKSTEQSISNNNKESSNLKPIPQVDGAGYTIQVGAFSDLNNMKQTQVNLAKAGFATATEKVTTPKGDSIRLMAGHYSTRESANEALLKLKSIGIEGIIKPNNTYDKSILRN
jgi:DedD protein